MKVETSVIFFFLLVALAFFVAMLLVFIITKRLDKIFHEKKRLFKGVKLTVLLALLITLCSFNGCVASYCSGLATVSKDYTQKETVGTISYNGFPIWFQKTAPGMRADWHLNRVYASWFIWTIFFMLIVVLIYLRPRFVKNKTYKQ